MTDSHNAWSEEQETLVRELFPIHTAQEVSERTGHSKSAVKRKASRLGITKPDSLWTDEEIAFLKEQIPITSTLIIADQLGRSRSSVKSKALNLGLHIPRLGSWSAENDITLRELWPTKIAIDIAKILGRSRNSVIGRARRLGLPSKRSETWGDGVTAAKERAAADIERRKKRALEKPQPKKPLLDVILPVVSDIEPLLVSIVDLKLEHCRWPYGDAGAIRYCGHRAIDGQSYCYAHYCMSYQLTNPKTRAAVMELAKAP